MLPRSARSHGRSPVRIAVIHGGPGAAGEMAPVARELAQTTGPGVLEPFQRAMSIDGQVEELETALQTSAEPPVVLIGFSWGAWLSWILAARCPALVRKLILIGAGPFREEYAARIHITRLSRLTPGEHAELERLTGEGLPDQRRVAQAPGVADRRGAARALALLAKADAYDPLPAALADTAGSVDFRPDIYGSVWPEAVELRRSGKLLELGVRISCPVVALHGEHDPHPAEGVEKPLSEVLQDFRFILLESCGYKPWIERQARDGFYSILREELGEGGSD